MLKEPAIERFALSIPPVPIGETCELFAEWLTSNTDSRNLIHSSALRNRSYDDRREGDAVELTVGKGPKGPRPESVTLLD